MGIRQRILSGVNGVLIQSPFAYYSLRLAQKYNSVPRNYTGEFRCVYSIA